MINIYWNHKLLLWPIKIETKTHYDAIKSTIHIMFKFKHREWLAISTNHINEWRARECVSVQSRQTQWHRMNLTYMPQIFVSAIKISSAGWWLYIISGIFRFFLHHHECHMLSLTFWDEVWQSIYLYCELYWSRWKQEWVCVSMNRGGIFRYFGSRDSKIFFGSSLGNPFC